MSEASPRGVTCAIIGLSEITSAPSEPTLTGGRLPLPWSHAPAIARIPRLEVIAVCDVNPAAIAAFQERWGATWPNMTAYTDAAALIENESPDILAVVTPDHLHADIVIAAASRGIPAIMCEKPLATSVEDADRMIAACQEHGTRISIDHTRRWDPFFHQAKLLIDAGRIGEVITVSGIMHGPRAMLYRNGTHILDLMHLYAGAAPLRVSARLEPGYDGFTEYRGDGGHAPSSEPAASAYIEYANGVRGQYNGMKGTYPLVEWDVIGTRGRIRIGSAHAELWEYDDGRDTLVQLPFPAAAYMIGGVQGAWEELIAALDDPGLEVRSDAVSARATVATIDAILRSHQQHGALVDLR
jgi:predicted dehydrogenase